MGHPVGGLTGGEETRVLSIYTFISSNPSAISLAKAHNFIGFIWSKAQWLDFISFLWSGGGIICVLDTRHF